MSFISVFGTSKFITVVSDGMVVDTRTGEQLDANHKKFFKISDKQFIAMGGSKFYADEIIKQLGYFEQEVDLETLAHELRDLIIKDIPPEEASCQVIIGGVDTNEIVFYSFNNKSEQELIIQKPTGYNPMYSTIAVGEIPLNIDAEVNKLNSSLGLKSPTKAIKLQKRLNNIVATVDPSVNKRTFHLTIRND